MMLVFTAFSVSRGIGLGQPSHASQGLRWLNRAAACQLIREKIDRCSVTVVYLSDKTASSKWVNWEIEESLMRGKGVIGVYKVDTPPAKTPPAFQQNGCKAVKWEHAALTKAIEDASTKR